MKKGNWMRALADHFENSRMLYPEEKLMIVFDLDGTILDMRHMVINVLKAYDKKHRSHFFKDLAFFDIQVHENHVDQLLLNLKIPSYQFNEILNWYHENRWNTEFILNAHRPFQGVLGVIRYFQLQPNTSIGLNTGRPESIREETLNSLNQLGREFKVQFSEGDLQMNPCNWEERVKEAKVDGIRKFQKKGFRIIAVVDNEAENLREISSIDAQQEIFFRLRQNHAIKNSS